MWALTLLPRRPKFVVDVSLTVATSCGYGLGYEPALRVQMPSCIDYSSAVDAACVQCSLP